MLTTIIAVYAIARLIQTPVEFAPERDPKGVGPKRLLLVVISAIAIIIIATQWKNAHESKVDPNDLLRTFLK